MLRRIWVVLKFHWCRWRGHQWGKVNAEGLLRFYESWSAEEGRMRVKQYLVCRRCGASIVFRDEPVSWNRAPVKWAPLE